MDLKIFSVFLSVFLITQNLYGQDNGFKYFRNYSYKEYDHQAQNWGIAQAKNGIIYVANNGGVLEFDGVSWRVIYVPNYTVRSLAVDELGTVYIGGRNEIGYLAPDTKGSLKYVSLLDQLDDNQKKFSTVWRTHATKEGIYFCPSQLLLRWNPRRKQMEDWKPTRRFLYSFTINGRLLIHQEKKGLMQMVNDSLEPLSGAKIFANTKDRIFMVAPYKPDRNAQTMLIGTRLSGFYLYNGKTLEPFPTEVDDYLKKSVAYHGIRLSSPGDFALATRFGGLVIMDSQGRLKYIFDKTSGLQDNDVKYVLQDNQENLWLCLEKGISRLEYRSPFFIYDNRSGLPGIVLSVLRCNNDLYVGTTKGLYLFHFGSKNFRPVSDISGSCWSLLSVGESVLSATSRGVFLIDNKNNKKEIVISDLSFVLSPSKRYPGRIWCGTNSGLVALIPKKRQLIEKQRFEIVNQGIRDIAEDKNGHLWLVTSTGSIVEVDFPVHNDEPVVTSHHTSPGLSGVQVYSEAVAAGHVMFATDRGILRFEEKDKKFIPDQTFGPEFADGSRPVFRIAEDKNKNIWFHSESRNYRAALTPGGSFRIDSKPFLRIPTTAQVNAIYPDPDGETTWFASFEGLIRCDTRIKKNYSQNFKTLVRKVLVNGELIFDGYKNITGNASGELFPILEYKDRNLHFEFAAPFFEVETEILYRCFLEGYDGRWPAWNKDTKRNYTNLDAGLYTFRVQAKNVYQHPGGEGVFQFRILPPWYKTLWAFGIYGIALFLLVFLILKWRLNKLEREKQRLEQIVKERTEEINEKNQQLEKQTIKLQGQSNKLNEKNLQLEEQAIKLQDQSKKINEKNQQLKKQTLKLQDQSEKLKEIDKVKSRFFANISHEFRTPLTLIMGPLEKMLSGSHDRDQGKELKMMLRSSQRLLRLINRLLDLSKLDSGKMKLNVLLKNIIPFIKAIVSTFESLAHQNQVDLNLDVEEEEVILSFDPEKLEEVLGNLLINAIKYTPHGGKVTVSTRRGSAEGSSFPNGYFELSVRDTGVGIPRDKLTHIFDRFYQTGDSRQRNHKGFGIGLALTKELVLLHHGKIDVHSSGGEDSGTEFVIRLPLGAQHLESDEKDGGSETDPTRKEFLDIDNGYMVEDEESEAAETPEPPEENEKPREKYIVLVVEDNADVRKYIRDSLESHYAVVEARNGHEGINKAKKRIPDLIVSDIMMPEKDGYELCRELKQDVKTSHIPIILLTAKASDQSVIEGLETGADDYITKPFNTEILMARIRNLIELRSHLQQKFRKLMVLQPNEILVSSVDEKFLKDVQDIIERKLSDPEFNVKQLSKRLGMSRVTLYRKMMALIDESPTDFIRSYRLKRAAQLLEGNFGCVSEVAIEVGFSNLGYFSRCFKEKFHQLPSTYQASESE
jgi:signal transduction histidine kinase/DNA-binding response OmpR family regulator